MPDKNGIPLEITIELERQQAHSFEASRDAPS
jgi:hypothetical protein